VPALGGGRKNELGRGEDHYVVKGVLSKKKGEKRAQKKKKKHAAEHLRENQRGGESLAWLVDPKIKVPGEDRREQGDQVSEQRRQTGDPGGSGLAEKREEKPCWAPGECRRPTVKLDVKEEKERHRVRNWFQKGRRVKAGDTSKRIGEEGPEIIPKKGPCSFKKRKNAI